MHEVSNNEQHDHEQHQDFESHEEHIEVINEEPSSSARVSSSKCRWRRPLSFNNSLYEHSNNKSKCEDFKLSGKDNSNCSRKMRFRFLKHRNFGKERTTTLRRRRSSWSGEHLMDDDDDNVAGDGSPDGCNRDLAVVNRLEWFQEQQSLLQRHQRELQVVQSGAFDMQQKSIRIGEQIIKLQTEIKQLQAAMEQAQNQMRKEVESYEKAQADLAKLQIAAIEASQAVTDSIRRMKEVPPLLETPPTPQRSNNMQNKHNPPDGVQASPPRERAVTAPANSVEFTEANDMKFDWFTTNSGSSTLSSSSSCASLTLDTLPPANDFVFVDHNLAPILKKLDQLGFDVATDESDRFVPTHETEKLLSRYRKSQEAQDNSCSSNDNCSTWPLQPWHGVYGDDVLIWTGEVKHDGLGSGWPVCKCRGLVQTSPKALLEYLMDSSKVREYNKMSLGREDLYYIQSGVDKKAANSSYGIPGDCKIVKATNKPRLLPITIEMISLMHCKEIENIPGSFLMVYRSCFEDSTANGDVTPVIRSEMLLGAVLVRPYDQEHQISEMTSITHMYSPGVPEMIARRAAPSAAEKMVKDIQHIFKN